MTYRFRSVAEDTEPLRVSVMIAGGSGSGKTYTACLLARGLTGGQPWGLVDTEGDRGKHYAREFPEMMRLPLSAEENGEIVGYPPERMIAVIEAAEAAGLQALVIDSFSHAWEGVQGILELQAQELDRISKGTNDAKFSQLAWAAVKPRARRLTNRIIQAKMHIILCVRAKPMLTGANGKPTRANKLRRPDLAWDVAADKDMVFEMTTTFLMDPARPGVSFWPPIKCADTFRNIFYENKPIGTAAGEALAKWSKGDHQTDKKVYDEARAKAREGRAAFIEYWQSETGIKNRPALRAILPQLQQLADEAEANASADDDNPFAPSENDTIPPDVEEQIREQTRAMAEAET